MARYILIRLFNLVLTIWVGVTAVFIVMRFIPTDPIEAMIGKLNQQSSGMSEFQMNSLRESLSVAFGLDGTFLEQYFTFLTRNFITFDYGPSLSSFPTTVAELLARALPWTIGLLATSTVIGWMLGNLIGLFAGVFPNRRLSRIAEAISVVLYPIPYYVLALALGILFSNVWQVFPISFSVRGEPWTFQFLSSVIYNSVLPSVSILIGIMGWWVISMKALSGSAREEEFVRFAYMRNVPERRILTHYIFRNTLPPQVTILAIQISLIFSGSILTEILFQYPGVGLLLVTAVGQGDYNLMMSIISMSIIAVAIATFLVDMAYPFLDPRIRYSK